MQLPDTVRAIDPIHTAWGSSKNHPLCHCVKYPSVHAANSAAVVIGYIRQRHASVDRLVTARTWWYLAYDE